MAGSRGVVAVLVLTALVGTGSCTAGGGKVASTTSTSTSELPVGALAFRRALPSGGGGAAIFRMGLDGSGLRQLSRPGTGVVDSFPDVSPDGSTVAFQRESPSMPLEVWTVAADGSAPERLVDPGCPGGIRQPLCEEGYPQWRRDGRLSFAWWSGDDPSSENPRIDAVIASTDAAGSSPAVVVPHASAQVSFHDSEPTWSPDGDRVAFRRLMLSGPLTDRGAIFVARADGTSVRQVTPWELGAEDPDWSPVGDTIAFHSSTPDADLVGQVHSVRADGTGLERLTSLPEGTQVGGPAWSPDGRWLVIPATGIAGELDLHLMAASGGPLTPLTRTPERESAPDWL